MTKTTDTSFNIVAGPIVRRLTDTELVLWYVSDKDLSSSAQIYHDTGADICLLSTTQQTLSHQVGSHAFIYHQVITFAQPLSCGQVLEYDVELTCGQERALLTDLVCNICYSDFHRPRIVYQQQIQQVLHGSCRKPHHDQPDSMVRIDQHLKQAYAQKTRPAAMLLMSGDQVYVDDVAGPFLQAIQQTIARLGLFDEAIPGATVSNYDELSRHPNCFYRRTELLPKGKKEDEVKETFFKAKQKPIFTSVNAKNHLITLSEVLAMYFLVWSPELWQGVTFDINNIPDEEKDTFSNEERIVKDFVSSLTEVRRALANIPVYMIFDDHDITDDWNLTREWEEYAYGHPLSRRIIGNALFGYWLCQGLGNNPAQFDTLLKTSEKCFTKTGIESHNQLIDELFNWNYWHYELDTSPKVIVLDTRTHRWRSEKNAGKPSGLLDFERLKELKAKVTGEETVIIVSAAPIFGVKVIEAIQKLFTWFGQALTVDAENWMAHKGTAKVLLQILTDKDTAEQYIILSGDVHYSFTYDVRLRFTHSQPSIHQLTASGFKNQFPLKLISMLDKFNRYLYGHKSPLNWFTKRRRMNISTRYPDRKDKSRSLVSKSAVGLLEINKDRKRPTSKILTHDGSDIEFK